MAHICCFLVLLVYLFACPQIEAGRELEKDPIKNTQTDPVLVTEDLLKKDSDRGPASPSFKIGDTSGFFSKKPYVKESIDELLEINLNDKDESLSQDLDDWFEVAQDNIESTEAIDEKELK